MTYCSIPHWGQTNSYTLHISKHHTFIFYFRESALLWHYLLGRYTPAAIIDGASGCKMWPFSSIDLQSVDAVFTTHGGSYRRGKRYGIGFEESLMIRANGKYSSEILCRMNADECDFFSFFVKSAQHFWNYF